MKRKLLFVTPHLSTGGMPQYLLKQVEVFREEFDIMVVEVADHSPIYIVQKERIRNIVPLKTLGENRFELINIINNFEPDHVHFTEIPEHYLGKDLLKEIFLKKDRTYDLVVSTHGSKTDPDAISFHPDRYVMPCNWVAEKYKHLAIDTQVWEYPIEDYKPDKIEAKKKLGLEEDWKHVLNVGLFSWGKNQKEIFQVARLLEDYKIKFHFVGNQAPNFKDYWEPLMKDKPDNCIIWGERNDVHTFYEACDLFYFSSILELNPLSIKEALSWKMPSIFRRLSTYQTKYDNEDLVSYIDDDLDKTIDTVLKKLGFSEQKVEYDYSHATVILAYANDDFRKNLLNKCLRSVTTPTILSSHYPVDVETQMLADWTIYEKENPLLWQKDFDKYAVNYNYYYTDVNGNQITKRFDYEHSYAVYTLIRSGLRYSQGLGNKLTTIVNYDYELNPTIIKSHEKYFDEYDIVFYRYDKNDVPEYEKSVCTGFFTGKTDILLEYFNKYPTLASFYGDPAPYYFFESKVYRYFLERPDIRFKELVFTDLEKEIKTNQEGVLEFSMEYKKNRGLV